MKKGFVIGMIALSTTMAFTTAFAAGTAAKAPREMLVDYSKTVRDIIAKAGASKGVNTTNRGTVDKYIEQDLGISGSKKTALLTSLSGTDATSAARMEGLVSIIAAKKISENIAKTDAAEAKSIEAAAKASVDMLANASLVGVPGKVPSTLVGEALTLVRESMSKMSTLGGEILLKFSKAERDSYTAVLERYNELTETGAKNTAEEAFVQAIMDVKKVDRAKALETVRKLKECV